MEIIILLIVVVAILAYYGFMKSAETLAVIGNREVSHLDRQHKVSIIERTAKLNDRVNEDTITSVAAMKAKLDALDI